MIGDGVRNVKTIIYIFTLPNLAHHLLENTTKQSEKSIV